VCRESLFSVENEISPFKQNIEIGRWCTNFLKTEKNKIILTWLLDVHPIRVVGTRIQVGWANTNCTVYVHCSFPNGALKVIDPCN
jgi:hypothetical protein